MIGGHLIRHWSRKQHAVALSSGEAELYSLNKGGQESLGLKQMAGELGWHLAIKLKTDSAAARGTIARTGAGKLKHIQVNEFWLQEMISARQMTIEKIPRDQNIADISTHHWESKDQKHFSAAGLRDLL